MNGGKSPMIPKPLYWNSWLGKKEDTSTSILSSLMKNESETAGDDADSDGRG